MGEIKSAITTANRYVSAIESANTSLAADSVAISEDAATTLAVNGNGTALNNSSKQAISAISKHISDDCGRIRGMAQLFEEKDEALARGK